MGGTLGEGAGAAEAGTPCYWPAPTLKSVALASLVLQAAVCDLLWRGGGGPWLQG